MGIIVVLRLLGEGVDGHSCAHLGVFCGHAEPRSHWGFSRITKMKGIIRSVMNHKSGDPINDIYPQMVWRMLLRERKEKMFIEFESSSSAGCLSAA